MVGVPGMRFPYKMMMHRIFIIKILYLLLSIYTIFTIAYEPTPIILGYQPELA
jgi:hypothetical protein